MTATVVPLLANTDLRILQAYISNTPDEPLEAVFDAMGISRDAAFPRLEVAVAQVLLAAREATLPQWGMVKADGEVVLGRQAFERAEPGGPLRFHGQFVCCINWADSGPGFSWPESYHVFRVPGFERYVVTASRDSTDACGCTDNAIGHCAADIPAEEAARSMITAFWRMQRDSWDQQRWACLFDTGLVDRDVAQGWADEVWPPEVDEEEEDGDMADDDDNCTPAGLNIKKPGADTA